jgi:hypothetical protein
MEILPREKIEREVELSPYGWKLWCCELGFLSYKNLYIT